MRLPVSDCISRADTIKAMCAGCEWEGECGGDCEQVEVVEGMPPGTPKPILTEEVREALMRLTMCAREECNICKYEDNCWFDKQVEMATENMHIILNAFDGTPTERTGEWIVEEKDSIYGKKIRLTCSECGDVFDVTESAYPYERYCRYCGAKMKGKEDA